MDIGMPSGSIIDSRLLIRLDLSDASCINTAFADDLHNLAHLGSQVLLYDRVVVPTYDFGIIPALLTWFGFDLLTRILRADALSFVRRRGLLGYVGNGNGISTFGIEAGKKHLRWWQDAMFAASSRSLELQLASSSSASSLTGKQRNRLTDLILSKSNDLTYDNDFFLKQVVHESYIDVMDSPPLSRYVVANSQRRPDGSIDLRWLPQIHSDQLRVLRGDGTIRDSVDVVLRVAEINMELVIAAQNNGADLYTSSEADRLLEHKLLRAGIKPPLIKGFVRLLDLNSLPDIRPAIVGREISVDALWRIRQSRKGKRFRQWLRHADSYDARQLERAYVEALGKPTLADALPVRLIRLCLTTAASILLTGIGGLVSGLVADATDSFFVEQWLKGYSPKVFFDALQKLVPAQGTESVVGRTTNGGVDIDKTAL